MEENEHNLSGLVVQWPSKFKKKKNHKVAIKQVIEVTEAK